MTRDFHQSGGASQEALHLSFHPRQPPFHLGHLIGKPLDLAGLRCNPLLKQINIF